MESLLQLVDNANGFLWNVVLIVLLCGTGIFYTIKLKFIQVRKFGEGFKLLFGNLGHKGEKKAGEMTPFQSVATAIAAQVGTGNLAGAATALFGGGPRSHLLDVAQRILRNGYHLCRGYPCTGI